MKRILAITNAQAGSNDEDAVQVALDILRRGGADVVVAATSDLDELGRALDERSRRDVVVAGGDGSMHAVVAALHSRDQLSELAIGLIPLGTGNDFARGVGIPLDPREAAEVIASGRRTPIDLLTDADGDVVVNAVHVGVGAEAAREADAWKPRLGKLGYAIGALVAGIRTEGLRLRVAADGQLLADGRRRVLQVAVGNGCYVGGGTQLTPDAEPFDSLADVLVSFAVGPIERLAYAIRLMRGTHREHAEVRSQSATRIDVSGEPFWCNTDGELSGPFRQRSWTIHPAAWTLTVPAPGRSS